MDLWLKVLLMLGVCPPLTELSLIELQQIPNRAHPSPDDKTN